MKKEVRTTIMVDEIFILIDSQGKEHMVKLKEEPRRIAPDGLNWTEVKPYEICDPDNPYMLTGGVMVTLEED